MGNEFNQIAYRKSGFLRNVVISFISGFTGAALLLGIFTSTFNLKNETTDTSSVPSNNLNVLEGNLDLVSLSNYSDTAVSVAEKVLPSIVGIKVQYSVKNIFGGQSVAEAEGSGIIINEEGYILTNNHVIDSSSASSYYNVSEASKVEVFLHNDEIAYEAKIIGSDKQTDLAIIKIEKEGLIAATLGNSADIKIGEFSMAIGNPLGMQSSVTCGVISAINREVTDSTGRKFTLIQTDASINSGNSGGALVNSKGEVIGINTMKFSGEGVEGMGFSIPISSTTDIVSQLIQYSKVKRPYIGITGLDLTEKTASANDLPIGIYIKEIADFSPAQKAELKVGDVILSANGTKVETMEELNDIKNKLQINDKIDLKVHRNGKEIDITVILGEQP